MNRCCNERGPLSLALPPDFTRNGLMFLYATGETGATVLSRVRLYTRTLEVAPGTLKVLLKIPPTQPRP